MNADTAGMENVAKRIRDDADSFKSMSEKLCETIENEIGESAEHTTWNGPNAGTFATEFKAKIEEFNKAYNNLISCADNISSQASSWNSFESM